MPFCPSCRSEYLPEIARCPDCGATLVDELPAEQAEAAPEEYQQAEVCTVTGEVHARLLQDVLASQGIPSRTESAWPFEGTVNVFSPPAPIGGGLGADRRIMVNREQLERALIIYRDFEQRASETVDDPSR